MKDVQEKHSVYRTKLERKAKKDNEAIASTTSSIRCYGKTGFFAPITQPDGRVIQKFFYGREGD